MQTIIVTVNQHGENTHFQIDSKIIATITKDFPRKGRYSSYFGVYGIISGVINCSNYHNAFLALKECFTTHFVDFGLNVEFKLKE